MGNFLWESTPYMKSSNRSTQPGLLLCGLASGEISTGWSVTNVGWIRCCSTSASNTSACSKRWYQMSTLPADLRLPGKGLGTSPGKACCQKAALGTFCQAHHWVLVLQTSLTWCLARVSCWVHAYSDKTLTRAHR